MSIYIDVVHKTTAHAHGAWKVMAYTGMQAEVTF